MLTKIIPRSMSLPLRPMAVILLTGMLLFTAYYCGIRSRYGYLPIERQFSDADQKSLLQKLPVHGAWFHSTGGLRYRVIAASLDVKAGELLLVAIEIENVSPHEVTLYGSGHPPFSGTSFVWQLNDRNASLVDERSSPLITMGYFPIPVDQVRVVGECAIQIPEVAGTYEISAYVTEDERYILLPPVTYTIE